MVDVTKEGNVPAPENWIAEIQCVGVNSTKGCGAMLKVTKDDVVLMKRYDRFPHYYTAIKCPRCLQYSHVEVPITISEALLKKKSRAIFERFDNRI